MLLGTLIFFRQRARALHTIENTLLSWPGVTTQTHRFGGMEFVLGRREIGHLHGSGLLDIPFTKPIRDEVVSTGKALPHHIYPQSGWISFFVRGETDVPNAVALLRRNFKRWQNAEPAAHVDVL